MRHWHVLVSNGTLDDKRTTISYRGTNSNESPERGRENSDKRHKPWQPESYSRIWSSKIDSWNKSLGGQEVNSLGCCPVDWGSRLLTDISFLNPKVIQIMAQGGTQYNRIILHHENSYTMAQWGTIVSIQWQYENGTKWHHGREERLTMWHISNGPMMAPRYTLNKVRMVEPINVIMGEWMAWEYVTNYPNKERFIKGLSTTPHV